MANVPQTTAVRPAGAGETARMVSRTGTRALDAGVQFEALLMQNFIEAMLPKDADNVFGSGIAGGFWRSMLAEKLAMELAHAGTLGIADMIARGWDEANAR